MPAAVKRLVLRFDGTWNTDRSNTNVSRLFRKIADDQSGCADQRRFYDEGVGTRWGERIRAWASTATSPRLCLAGIAVFNGLTDNLKQEPPTPH